MPSIDEMFDVATKGETPSVDKMLDAATEQAKPQSIGDMLDVEMQKRDEANRENVFNSFLDSQSAIANSPAAFFAEAHRAGMRGMDLPRTPVQRMYEAFGFPQTYVEKPEEPSVPPKQLSPEEKYPHSIGEALQWAKEGYHDLNRLGEEAAKEEQEKGSGNPSLDRFISGINSIAPKVGMVQSQEVQSWVNKLTSSDWWQGKDRSDNPPTIEPLKTGALANISSGVQRSAAKTFNFFVSPEGVALLGTSLLSEDAQKAVAGAFSLQMAKQVPEQVVSLAESKNSSEFTERALDLVTSSGMMAMAAGHAISETPGVGKVLDSNQKEVITDGNKETKTQVQKQTDVQEGRNANEGNEEGVLNRALSGGDTNSPGPVLQELSKVDAEALIQQARAGDARSKNGGKVFPESVKDEHHIVANIPLSALSESSIEFLRTSTDPERVKAYQGESIETPVYLRIGRSGEPFVSDGGHRVMAAVKRGDSTIRAVMAKSDFDQMAMQKPNSPGTVAAKGGPPSLDQMFDVAAAQTKPSHLEVDRLDKGDIQTPMPKSASSPVGNTPKEPWEQTRAEASADGVPSIRGKDVLPTHDWMASKLGGLKSLRDAFGTVDSDGFRHAEQVALAIRNGEKVPAKVLADYPEFEELTPVIPPEEKQGIGSIYQGTHRGKDVWFVQEKEKRGFGDQILDTKEDAQQASKITKAWDQERKNSEEAIKANKEFEANAKAEREDLNGFGSDLTPMQRGKVVKQMTSRMNYDGQPMTRRDIIRKLVNEGRTVEKLQDGTRILSHEDGRFLSEKVLTKAGIDYAQHLIDRAPDEASRTRTASPQETFEPKPEGYTGGPGAMGPKEAEEMAANRNMLSNKNAAVDEARAARGQQPLMSRAKETLGQWWDQAIDIIAKDDQAAPKLVQSILDDPNPKTSKTDEAVLLHHRVDLTNEIEQLADVVNNKFANAEEQAQARQDYDKAMKSLEDLDQATRKIGSTWGEAGRMRQASMADDYSPASLLRKAQASQGGKSLTPDQVGEITELGKDITKAQDESDIQDEITAKKTEDERNDDAEKNINDIKTRTAKEKLAKGEPTPEDRLNKILTGLKRKADNPDSIGSYIQKLAEHFVKEDLSIERDPLVDKVHGAVKDILPDATREEIRDAISGYGKYSELNKDAVKVRLRDLKGQLQQVSKIDDMMKKGQLPEKTGVERRKPSAEERTLIKEVNRIKKELQLDSNDPTKLQGALDAIKTRLRNRIEELNLALKKGEKLPEKGRKVIEDEETKTLRAERDRVQKEYDSMVGVETDAIEAAKERKLTQDIEDLSRQIAVGEFEQQGKTGTPTADTQKVAELKVQKEDLLKQKREMIKAKTAKTPEERQLLTLEKRRDKLRQRVAAGDISTRTGKPTVDTKEIAAVKEDIAKLNDQIAEMREKANPKPTQEELRERQLDKQISELEKKINAGDLSAKTGKPTVDTKEIAEKKAKLEELNKQLADMRKAAKPRLTPDEIANKVFKTRAANRIKELEERIRTNDFSKRVPRKAVLDAESQKAKVELEKKKLEFDRAALKYKLANRTRTEKILDGLVKWNRTFLLSGVKTLAKLSSAAAEINVIAPVERAVGAGFGKLLPGLAKDAPRYGQFSLRSEGKAIGEMWKNFFSDFTSELKTGHMDIDVLYGKPQVTPPELKNFIQHIHGALKASARRNEFTRSLEARLEDAAVRGEDVHDPMVQTKYAVEAYKDANRAIFMENNAITSGWRRFLSALREPNKETGKVSLMRRTGETAAGVLLPIVKIPTNLMFRYFEYSPLGLGTGAVRLARAFSDGFEKLHPSEKELIFRNLARGSIGTALMLWGAFNSENVGGYYQRGEKRKEGDVKEGGIKIMGFEVPKFLVHHPLLEQAQIGASIRKLVESKLDKKEKEQMSYPSASVAIAAKIITDLPFVGENLKIDELKTGSGQVRGAGELAKRVVPLGVQDIAKFLDKDAEGNTVKRDPQNAGQAIEAALPVLRQNVPEKKEGSTRSPMRPPRMPRIPRPGSR